MGLEALGVSWGTKLKFSGSLLIVGSGRCVWDDLMKIDYKAWDVMCINDMVMHFPGPVHHAYSNDHKWLLKWVEARRPRLLKDYPNEILLHSCGVGCNTRIHHWPWPGHGSSGLCAVYTGLGLGYDEIVLAGVPLDGSGHYFDPPWGKTNFQNEVPDQDGLPRYWRRASQGVFDGKVTSLSGRTRELLGPPKELI